MTQKYIGQITDTSTESGDDLAARLNDFDNAHRTNQSGATRPSGSLAGAIWTRVVAGVYDLMLFNGTKDVAVLTGDGNLAGLTDTEAAQANLDLKALALKDKAAIVGDTTGTLTVLRGGTGATTAGAALTALGGVAQADKATKLEAQAGADNTKWMTPARVFDAVRELAIGEGQTWVDVKGSRSASTVYQNTTGRSIEVHIRTQPSGSERPMQVSPNGTSGWVTVGTATTQWFQGQTFIVPPNWRYRINGAVVSISLWSELR